MATPPLKKWATGGDDKDADERKKIGAKAYTISDVKGPHTDLPGLNKTYPNVEAAVKAGMGSGSVKEGATFTVRENGKPILTYTNGVRRWL